MRVAAGDEKHFKSAGVDADVDNNNYMSAYHYSQASPRDNADMMLYGTTTTVDQRQMRTKKEIEELEAMRAPSAQSQRSNNNKMYSTMQVKEIIKQSTKEQEKLLTSNYQLQRK